MPVPAHLLVHTITVVTPAIGVDAYNNETEDFGPAATRRQVTAWLQQDTRRETFPDGRAPLDGGWLLITNDPAITGRDRIEWDGLTFTVDGPTEPTYTPAGFHHLEATLRTLEG